MDSVRRIIMLENNWGGTIYIAFSIGFFMFGALYAYILFEILKTLKNIEGML